MLKKSIPLLVALVAPALLTGCPVYVDTLDNYPTYGSPDVVVVGEDVPPDIEYGQPTYTHGEGDGNPIIDSFTQNISEVKKGQPITFTVVAHDPNKRSLQFNWSATGGTISANTGRVVSWDPPDNPGIYTVTVVISNGNGGVATGSLNLTVHPNAASPTPLPPVATPTPMPLPTPLPVVLPTPGPTSTPAPTPMPTAVATPVPTPTANIQPAQDPTKSSISGVVKDDAGLLAGAEVILTSGDANVPFQATVTTGADGAFHFANVPPDIRLVISARKDGYGEKLRTISSVKGMDTVWNFDGTYALARI